MEEDKNKAAKKVFLAMPFLGDQIVFENLLKALPDVVLGNEEEEIFFWSAIEEIASMMSRQINQNLLKSQKEVDADDKIFFENLEKLAGPLLIAASKSVKIQATICELLNRTSIFEHQNAKSANSLRWIEKELYINLIKNDQVLGYLKNHYDGGYSSQLSRRFSETSLSQHPVSTIVAANNVGLFKEIFKRTGLDPNAEFDSQTKLFELVKSKEMVEALIEAGCDLNVPLAERKKRGGVKFQDDEGSFDIPVNNSGKPLCGGFYEHMLMRYAQYRRDNRNKKINFFDKDQASPFNLISFLGEVPDYIRVSFAILDLNVGAVDPEVWGEDRVVKFNNGNNLHPMRSFLKRSVNKSWNAADAENIVQTWEQSWNSEIDGKPVWMWLLADSMCLYQNALKEYERPEEPPTKRSGKNDLSHVAIAEKIIEKITALKKVDGHAARRQWMFFANHAKFNMKDELLGKIEKLFPATSKEWFEGEEPLVNCLFENNIDCRSLAYDCLFEAMSKDKVLEHNLNNLDDVCAANLLTKLYELKKRGLGVDGKRVENVAIELMKVAKCENKLSAKELAKIRGFDWMDDSDSCISECEEMLLRYKFSSEKNVRKPKKSI
jgi:hypothetical protein